jgi:transposase
MNHEVTPDPRLEKRSKRRFSAAEKLRLLNELDQLPHGEKGGWLRRNGLYASQLAVWRKQRESDASALEPKTVGRKPMDAKDRQIAELLAIQATLEKRVRIAEGLVELQKKAMALIEASNAA